MLLITYSDEEAAEVASLAPDLMMTAGVWDDAQRARLEEAGVNMTRVVAWMGTRAPDAARIAALGGTTVDASRCCVRYRVVGQSGWQRAPLRPRADGVWAAGLPAFDAAEAAWRDPRTGHRDARLRPT